MSSQALIGPQGAEKLLRKVNVVVVVGGWWVVGVQGKNHNSSCSYEQAEPSRARAELVNI